jgi:hypothetical protein
MVFKTAAIRADGSYERAKSVLRGCFIEGLDRHDSVLKDGGLRFSSWLRGDVCSWGLVRSEARRGRRGPPMCQARRRWSE